MDLVIVNLIFKQVCEVRIDSHGMALTFCVKDDCMPPYDGVDVHKGYDFLCGRRERIKRTVEKGRDERRIGRLYRNNLIEK